MSAEPFSIRQHHPLVMTAPGGTIQYNGPRIKGIPIIEMRRSWHRLNFTMGISMLVGRHILKRIPVHYSALAHDFFNLTVKKSLK